MLRIKELRLESEKTQSEIAKILGISRQVYANYENNINEPPLEMLKKIADFFEVTVDYLLDRSDDFGIIQTTKPQDELTKEERELILDYRALTPALQKMLRATIETWKGSDANAGAKKNNKNTVAF